MKTIRNNRRSGFTLLEVLVAMGVFAIGALGVLAMVATTLHLNQNSRQITEASQLGVRQMERLQILPIDDTDITDCDGTAVCWLDENLAPSVDTEAAMRPMKLLGVGSGAGSALWYEVTWRVRDSGNRLYAEVVVYWPKNRNAGGGDWSADGLDCAGATPENCYSVRFHSYIN